MFVSWLKSKGTAMKQKTAMNMYAVKRVIESVEVIQEDIETYFACTTDNGRFRANEILDMDFKDLGFWLSRC